MPTAAAAFYFKAKGYRPGDDVPDDVAELIDETLLTDDGEDSLPDSIDAYADGADDQDNGDDLADTNLDDLEAQAEDGGPNSGPVVPAFDPDAHGVKDVLAYLEASDEAEYERVFAAEKAGQARKGVVGD